VALVLLGLWFVFALISMPDRSYETVTAWMHDPFNAVMLTLLIGTTVYHSLLGVQVVIEDYVSDHGSKVVSMLVLQFIHIVLGALGVFSVLRVAFGSAA
jgi:succinate dehydrogenase / fumarate reductase membrane anchor subunit